VKKLIAAALILTLPLTACATTNNAQKSAAGSPQQSNLTAAPTPSSTAAATATPTPTPVPTVSPANDASIPKTYRMNKNYDIVPIDPTGNKKVVLLTFDDGPKDMSMIGPMLDILDKHKAKAIFFENGYRIKAKPELLKLTYERGQIIGNHSWDHIELKKETNAKIDTQLADVQKIVKDILGFEPVFFRPPFASSNDHVREVAKSEKMLFMTWSDGSLDWTMNNGFDNTTKSKNLITNVFKLLHPGANILMHELPWTVKALDDLLTQLEDKGYSFVDPRAIDTESPVI
jgi:peptidoglycan/xylan/chitin deacetylase (PgdA/CDA1 family)